MDWQIKWDTRASKELQKLDKPIQREILEYLRERIIKGGDPRAYGKALVGNLAGLWRYRVQDHRIIGKIDDDKLTVFITKVAHRNKVYDD